MTESMKRRAISLGVITIMLLGLIIPAGAQTVQAADGSKKLQYQMTIRLYMEKVQGVIHF